MSDRFFDRPILNSPYEYPSRHWELDETGQPTSRILDRRRRVSFITPIPKPKKRGQREIVFDETAQALEAEGQQYELMEVINELRRRVDAWRSIPDPGRWRVTPETARLLQHWRSHRFGELRRARQSPRAATHPAHRQQAARIRAGPRQELPSGGQRRDRAVPQRDHQADRGPPAGREPLRSGSAARGHEHGRKGGPTRRRHPLRGVRLDADGGMGCQHRHPRARSACLRHPAPVRAGHRPGAAPAILRPERRGRVRRRVRRRARHPVRLHGPPRGRPAAAAARDG